jgi:hypothetical protein
MSACFSFSRKQIHLLCGPLERYRLKPATLRCRNCLALLLAFPEVLATSAFLLATCNASAVVCLFLTNGDSLPLFLLKSAMLLPSLEAGENKYIGLNMFFNCYWKTEG